MTTEIRHFEHTKTTHPQTTKNCLCCRGSGLKFRLSPSFDSKGPVSRVFGVSLRAGSIEPPFLLIFFIANTYIPLPPLLRSLFHTPKRLNPSSTRLSEFMMERYLRDDERVLTNVTSPTRDRNSHRSTPQRRDTASSKSSYSSDSSEQSAASFASSNSSVTSEPPWQQHLPAHLHGTNYDLPCEFTFTGCRLRFHSWDHEAWIRHTLSHFDHELPPRETTCLFCDDETAYVRTRNDPRKNWMNRMEHIGWHRAQGAQDEQIRPDFWLIDYMREQNRLSEEDYYDAIAYTEAPYPDDPRNTGFVPLSSNTKQKKERPEVHDLEKEERQRKREERRYRDSMSRHKGSNRRS